MWTGSSEMKQAKLNPSPTLWPKETYGLNKSKLGHPTYNYHNIHKLTSLRHFIKHLDFQLFYEQKYERFSHFMHVHVWAPSYIQDYQHNCKETFLTIVVDDCFNFVQISSIFKKDLLNNTNLRSMLTNRCFEIGFEGVLVCYDGKWVGWRLGKMRVLNLGE